MNKDTLRKLIWNAINTHFIVEDRISLATSLKNEPNKTIAQIIAVGFCNQYDISRHEVLALLGIENPSYDKKLEVFLKTVKIAAYNRRIRHNNPEIENFFQRYLMCSRYIRKRAVNYMDR